MCALYGGVQLPGQPDLTNCALLDRLPIPAIRNIHRVGFAFDREQSWELTSELSAEMVELERDISNFIPRDKLEEFTGKAIEIEVGHAEGFVDSSINANSAEQISKLLFDVLGIGRGQKLKTTKAGTRISSDKKQLTGLQFEHPVVPKILAFKERAKLVNTYSKALPKIAKRHPRGDCCPICELKHEQETWRVHTEITTTRAETGRFSSKSPNLQNIPQRSSLGERIRACFVASPGMRLVSVDFSQIELRVMAHLANCKSMIAIYDADLDLHVETAMQCFQLERAEDLDKIRHRIPAKTANFLTQYGGSGKALYGQLQMAFTALIAEGKLDAIPDWLTEEWCNRFIVDWFGIRPEVREYLDKCVYRARRYGLAWDEFGRIRLVPEMKSYHSWIRAAGERQSGNMPDQSMAAGQMKLAVAKVDEQLQYMREDIGWAWPLLPVHDQLICEVEEQWAETVLQMMLRVFDSVMDDEETGERMFRVPVKSDGEIMERWKK